ncbi:(Fe-S)-binding protein [Acrocarpospora sp. B8E8]|uniref:(Fe-S)-binding protein n=1 Tax=Acrocarpospora sp. B8E8 TaxID=3153572 RepID=UPI00325CB6DF
MRVALFITCVNDTLFPDTGRAVVTLLRRLGVDVEFPQAQTCCGQMHVNTGYPAEGVRLARHFTEVFAEYDAVVTPSGSCTAMIREQYPRLAAAVGGSKDRGGVSGSGGQASTTRDSGGQVSTPHNPVDPAGGQASTAHDSSTANDSGGQASIAHDSGGHGLVGAGTARKKGRRVGGERGRAWGEVVDEVVPKVYDLSEFLVDVLGVTDVGAYFPHRVTYHPTCHSLRGLHLGDRPRRLLEGVRGLELVALPGAEECCGFGGTFAVKNRDISAAMCADKVGNVMKTGAEVLCAADNSCLMHIGGTLHRQKSGVRVMHLAEILAATEAGVR